MEYLDIYNENGTKIGTENRTIVHQKGLWHKTIHCWLYDSEGNVFFQRRADRNTLYTTASGHVLAGETLKEGFGREVFEELGTKIDYENALFCNEVIFKMDRKLKDNSIFKDRVFANIYVCLYDKKYDFNYDFNEISELVKVNCKDALGLFEKEKGKIDAEVIRIENDKIITYKSEVDFGEFLVNENETAIKKYGDILKFIINII